MKAKFKPGDEITIKDDASITHERMKEFLGQDGVVEYVEEVHGFFLYDVLCDGMVWNWQEEDLRLFSGVMA